MNRKSIGNLRYLWYACNKMSPMWLRCIRRLHALSILCQSKSHILQVSCEGEESLMYTLKCSELSHIPFVKPWQAFPRGLPVWQWRTLIAPMLVGCNYNLDHVHMSYKAGYQEMWLLGCNSSLVSRRYTLTDTKKRNMWHCIQRGLTLVWVSKKGFILKWSCRGVLHISDFCSPAAALAVPLLSPPGFCPWTP